ncbi:MAG TPA: ROK family protein, partial [Anaerolineales bacterium]|nr:ROK family protein [Anaerolineales bacterium]
MTLETLYGGVEAGGTKFVCCIASGPNHIVEEIRFATTTPQETLRKTVQFFQPYVRDGKIQFIGVGCFGPLDLHPASPSYGFITATPKPGWSNTDVRGVLQQELNVPVAIDSDVNAAAVGEAMWG